MDAQTLVDAARCGHFVGLALGLGLGLYADTRFLGGLSRPIAADYLLSLRRIHGYVAAALALLWASGLFLLHARTGLDLAAFTPKLLTKLAVVTLLTVNAVLIESVALPLLARSIGRHFGELPTGWRLRLSLVGALSGACWLSALGLGVFAAFKTMTPETLALTIGGIYASALAGAVTLAVLVPLWRPTRRYLTSFD
ncbi:MAG: hypothetical protein QNJ30_19395 [Kiloniellales bacterium]|nr:hypothetical protein [Kiloniellales bacterium]